MNSGRVRAAPRTLNTASTRFQAISGRRRWKGSLQHLAFTRAPVCPDMLPVGHEVLAAEDEKEVEAAGPQTHGHPVLLHPEPVLGVLELLDTTAAVNTSQDQVECRAALFDCVRATPARS